MLTTLIGFGIGSAVLLALSWVVSFTGFKLLGPAQGRIWADQIGRVTGSLLVYGALGLLVVLAIQAARG